MHKKLTLEEDKEFREWARGNYSPYTPISGMWHPAVQEECSKINREKDEEVNKILGGNNAGL